jgi:hypothetical protein
LLREFPAVEKRKLEEHRTKLWTEDSHRFDELSKFSVAVHQRLFMRDDLGKCGRQHFHSYVVSTFM